jgi:outer membrane protein TolC
MRRAREETTESRALASAVEEAGARIRIAQSRFWPTFDLTESVQRGNHPVFVFSSLLGQRRFTAANFAIPVLNSPGAVTNTRSALVLEQIVFDGGLTRRSVSAATIGQDIARSKRDAARQDLAFRAAQAFVRVLELEATGRAAEAAVSAAESDRERARARREVGLVTEADVLAVEVHLADMRQRQIETMGGLAVERLRLAEATGLPLGASLALVHPPSRSASTDPGALVREALEKHPDLRQANLQLQLAGNARQQTRSTWWPSVGVQGGWESNGSAFDGQKTSWLVGAEVRMNLFRGFADQARMAEAGHAYERAAADRDRVARQVEVNVRMTLEQLAAARAREEAGRAALAQARESQRIIRDRYESGLATVTDVLRAAEAVLAAESRAVAAEMNVILQTIALDRALGRL